MSYSDNCNMGEYVSLLSWSGIESILNIDYLKEHILNDLKNECIQKRNIHNNQLNLQGIRNYAIMYIDEGNFI